MRLKDEETDGHRRICLSQSGMLACEQFRQGDEVAERFAHLLAIDGDHVVVNPVVHALCSA